MENCDKLFVYGTLRRDFKNVYTEFLQNHSKYVGNGYFFGHLYDVGYYPGAIYDPKSNERVFGDILLMKSKEEVLERLDTYEGIGEPNPPPYEYKREIITVFNEIHSVQCWTYLYNHPTYLLKKIDSGDYFKYMNE